VFPVRVAAALSAVALPIVAGGAVPATAGPPAGAASVAADSQVVTAAFTFVPPEIVVAPGDTLTHTNVDVAPHNVVATTNGPDGSPLFSGATIAAGERAAVHGVADLAPGSYPFVCTIHPTLMRGTVRVAGAAVAPAAVPAGVVPTPTSIAVFRDALYAASFAQDVVFRLPLLPGGLLGPATSYASGFRNPLGIAFAPDGTLFVSDSHPAATPGRQTAGRVWALPPGGGDAAAVGEVVVDELPNGRHNTNGLAVHDDRLYITNGNSTDDGVSGGLPEQPLSGTLLSVPLDARGVLPGDERLVVEARGMRNLYDVAFRPGTDEAWIPTNGLDFQDPFGEDTLLKARVDAEAVPDFGWPGCVYKAGPNGPEFGQNPAVTRTHRCDAAHTPPEVLLGLHVSADGLAFGPPQAPWNGDLFIALFGSNGTDAAGHKVVRVPIAADGKAGAPQDVLTVASPLDVTFGPDGVYVADFLSGEIGLLRAVG
jgi:glucose/arabinose dehydrogenase/plastocyanin